MGSRDVFGQPDKVADWAQPPKSSAGAPPSGVGPGFGAPPPSASITAPTPAPPAQPSAKQKEDEQAVAQIAQQLERLAALGVRAKPEYSVQDTINRWGACTVIDGGYHLLLIDLGLCTESSGDRDTYPSSDDVTYIDAEFVEGSDSYVALMNRLAEMSQGEFAITDIRCKLDLDTDLEGELSFAWHGRRHSFDFAVEDDWLDVDLFEQFNTLLDQYASDNRRFIVLEGGGQDFLLFFISQENYRAIYQLTSQKATSSKTPSKQPEGAGLRPLQRVLRAITMLTILAAAVFYFGPQLPFVADIPRNRAVSYLSEHLETPVTLTSTGNANETVQTFYFEDADGVRFVVIANYDKWSFGRVTPTLVCNYLTALANERKSRMARVFEPWDYDVDHHRLYLSLDDDPATLAALLTEELNALNTAIVDDPDEVFKPFGISVYCNTGRGEPEYLGVVEAPVTTEKFLSATALQASIEQALSKL